MSTEAKKDVKGAKQVKFSGLKTSASKPTAKQLELINQFTRRAFSADELYVGQIRLAHNAIDRDNERFSEEVLLRFAATAVRKTMLFDHDHKSRESAVGKFFDVEIEKMPIQQAMAETGEELRFPADVTEAWFLSPWFYIPKDGVDERTLVMIDAGIYDFASIGFRAESLAPIMDRNGKVMYWEYRGSGEQTEMTEGSLVYLGAQPGAAVKDAGDRLDKTPDTVQQIGDETPSAPQAESQGGHKIMKELLDRLKAFFGRNISEVNAYDDIKAAVTERVDDAVKAATQSLQEQVEKLTPLAEDGRAYRNGLINEYVSLKVKLCEASERPQDQELLKEMIGSYPLDFIKTEIAYLKARVCEKFPNEAQLMSGQIPERSGQSKRNPLIPTAEA